MGSMTKCYLLGAGASYGYSDNMPAELCPPLGDQFLTKGRNLGMLTEQDFPQFCGAVQDYLNTSASFDKIPRRQLSKVDIEELLNHIIEMEIEDWQAALGEVFYFIYEMLRLYNLLYDSNYNNYKKLALHFHEERFNVITLNYDTLFEIAIGEVGLGWDYRLVYNPPLGSIPLAKVHGSINWMNYMDPFPMTTMMTSDFTLSHVFKYIYSNRFYESFFDVYSPHAISNVSYERLIGPGFKVNEVAIIPPFLDYKDYHKIQYYNAVWGSAVEMIQNASELVIIGCRLREEDTKLLDLLDIHLDPDIDVTVVSGGETRTVGSKMRVLAPDATIDDTSYRYFKDYADDL